MSSKDVQLNSKKAYYVDISRAKQEVKLFCDDQKKLDLQIAKFTHKITSQDFKVGLKKKLGMQGRKRQLSIHPAKVQELKSVSMLPASLKAVVHLTDNASVKAMNLIRKALVLVKQPGQIIEKTLGGPKIK